MDIIKTPACGYLENIPMIALLRRASTTISSPIDKYSSFWSIFSMSSPEKNTDDHLELMGKIVSAYVANNAVPAAELTRLMSDVHSAIALLSRDEPDISEVPTSKEEINPAVSIKKSVQHDHIVCLEDGKKFRSLKRHLETRHNMTPDEYRSKWNLPEDYPMIAPEYSETRSHLAKEMGLGRGPRARRGPYSKRAQSDKK